MATPQSGQLTLTPTTTTPRSRVLQSPLSDGSIWKRLREAGFDEDSIKRRDKAALIAYIAKLETEIYEHEHQMGLLLLERKEWLSKYEQTKASAESAELMRKRDKAAHSSTLAEARKREESLKKALGIEKECVANLEKALHEMRTECAETKVAADSKLAESRNMLEDAQKKFTEAEAKLLATESLEAEASRHRSAAERKLHEVEAREDDLRRHILSFKSHCDAKEKEIFLERQSLSERQKTLQQSQERLLDGQALLNEREEYIFKKSQELTQLEKELESSKAKHEEERRALIEERGCLELNASSLSAREEAVIKREFELNKREENLLIQQQKLASKESDRMQQVMANQEAVLRSRKSDFETELEIKCKLVEEEIESKRRAWELREVDLGQREDLILEKEHELEVLSRTLSEKEKNLTERMNSLDEKERILHAVEREAEEKKIFLQNEKEEIKYMKLDLQKSSAYWKTERDKLIMKRKRAQKLELEVQANELKVEKAKFETEWELIDEKKEELRKEAERITEDRLAIEKFLNDERDFLKLEKNALLSQYKRDMESLSRDREAFMNKIEHERLEWFSKIHKEREDFLVDIELQKRELENCIDKRREEIESYLREREQAFEEEKKKELSHIASLRETVEKEMEQVNLEMQKLDAERRQINLDRERRDNEWAELNTSIEELKLQRQKLEKQRELLHADREEILVHIEQMKKLEDLKVVPDRLTVCEIHEFDPKFSKPKASAKRALLQHTVVQDGRLDSDNKINAHEGNGGDMSSRTLDPPSSAPLSWLKRCAETLLEHTQSNKKRKQLKDAVAMPSEEITEPCALSTQQNALEDKHELIALNKTPGGARETTVYIDKIITIQEVASVEDGRVTEDSKYQQEVVSQEIEKLEDHCDSISDANRKAKRPAGVRTRAEQVR
ncbi:unnamed protein product [Thlaspi arvense]|uniref:Nuclear matrix constituent protein 1-like protein n=1 Tax=Thlaspi arvense TaxID=13288 RepID=A0AAU9TEB4_THLAR|nr:unnamed protein product [Thlaspi arvense]